MTLLLIIAAAGGLYGWITYKPPEKKKAPAAPAQGVVTLEWCKQQDKQRKQAARKAQAAEDKAFFERKLPILHEMLDAANDSLAHANASLEYADLANRESGSSVVSGKQIATYRKERENALKQIMKLESQIHVAESKIEKAKYIIKYE